MTVNRSSIIKHRNVHFETRTVHDPGRPRIELLEEGGVVHALQVTCPCGKVTVVELEYACEPARTPA